MFSSTTFATVMTRVTYFLFGVAAMLLHSSKASAQSVSTVDPARAVYVTKEVRAPEILFLASDLRTMADASKEPIHVVINSPGGQVFAGLQFLDAMRAARSMGIRIECHVPGLAASMAFQFLTECSSIAATRHALFLWHPVRMSGFFSVTPQIASDLLVQLTLIEDAMLPAIRDLLQMSEEQFQYHYLQETMWTASSLAKQAPHLLRIVDRIDGTEPTWSRTAGSFDGESAVSTPFDRDLTYMPSPRREVKGVGRE